jgi:GNAT superfamily N-acetyltransferase
MTVTTMLYVEWGRLGEIGDLYVLPEQRRRGVASALINAAAAWCAEQECSAISVVVTSLGQMRHALLSFYRKQGFARTDEAC